MAREIEILLYRTGQSTPFSGWLASLRDAPVGGIVRARLNRIRLGNFGDCKSVGSGVAELRIDFGPGYRIYYGRQGSFAVVLLLRWRQKDPSQRHPDSAEILEGVFGCERSPVILN